MNLFEFIDEYPEMLGGSLIFLALLLFAIKITALNNEKLEEKIKNSELGNVGIYLLIASLLIPGLKLLFFYSY